MASSKLSLKFRIFKGNELVGFRELNQAVIKIGKVPNAHLHIDDESVSRMHAIIETLDNVAHIIDLGSTRGTFVNGKKINKAKLSDGDQIQVGDVRLELAMADMTAEAPVATPPPVPAAKPVLAVVPAAPVAAAPVAASAAPVAAPAPILPPAPAMAAFSAAMADNEVGVRAVEVATMLGDSVVNVKHCMDPKGGKVTTKTWGFVAGGLACLLASGIAFYSSVSNAAENKEALAYHTQVMHKPAHSFRPHVQSVGVDYMAFGGLAFGLLGITSALLRARREKKSSPFYRIGTAPGVEQPVDGAPTADFPMVAPNGDDFVFNYGAGMDGEMIVDGKSTPFSALAASGLARPSSSIAGAFEVSIPEKAKIRARAGQTTFLVTPVAKPREQAVPLFAMEGRTAAYLAGSLAAHLGLVFFLSTIPEADAGVNVSLADNELTGMAANNTQPDDMPQKPDPGDDDGAEAGNSSSGMALGPEGKSGKPDAVNEDGHLRVKDRGPTKQISREEAIHEAENAGILGSYSVIEKSIHNMNGEVGITSGFDGTEVYGPLFGAEGEGRGSFGLGVHDFGGNGGGCYGTDCGGVGTGRYRTIGNGPGGNDPWGVGGPGGLHNRNHSPSVPPVNIPMPTAVTDGLDKAIIKRYVKRNLSKIQYCYEKQLLTHPSLEGVVSVGFRISANGVVTDSNGKGMDDSVANCVAGVVKAIEFPKPSNGGAVEVNYPFTFHASH